MIGRMWPCWREPAAFTSGKTIWEWSRRARWWGTEKWVGVSTHNLDQFRAAAATSADYIAVGPVFATSSKANPDPVIGTEFIRRVRDLTDKPIVAIGGITLENAAAVIQAGADCVAVISDILRAPDRGARAKQYLETLGAANHTATA